MINRPPFGKTTRRIERFGGSKLAPVPSSRCLFIHARIDHRQLGATLQIDPSTCFYSTPKPRENKTVRILLRPASVRLNRIYESTITSLYIANSDLRDRESSRDGTLERLLYIYYWSSPLYFKEARRITTIKSNNVSLFETQWLREISK